jgi:hypothetical protein
LNYFRAALQPFSITQKDKAASVGFSSLVVQILSAELRSKEFENYHNFIKFSSDGKQSKEHRMKVGICYE